MEAVADKLQTDCILLDLCVSSKDELFRTLVGTLAACHSIRNIEQLREDILRREEIGSTCIGCGCAVPHARSSAVDSTIIAAARLRPARKFDAPDGEPVSLVFLVVGPEHNARLHIQLLSRLARLLHDPVFREELRNAPDAYAFRELIVRREA